MDRSSEVFESDLEHKCVCMSMEGEGQLASGMCAACGVVSVELTISVYYQCMYS